MRNLLKFIAESPVSTARFQALRPSRIRIVRAPRSMLRFALLLASISLAGAVLSGGPDGGSPVAYTAPDAYARPLPLLDDEQLAVFEQGREIFEQRWVVAPSPFGPWGRGPLSNGEVCTDCHARNGRGRPPLSEDEPMRSTLVRLSIPGQDAHGGPRPHPAYGDQLQFEGVLGKVPAEGEAYVRWRETNVVLGDGETVVLRAPAVEFRELSFGPMGTGTMRSLRVAPPVFGLGLLEAVPDDALLAIAQEQKRLGFAGRQNRVWDRARQAGAAGRFGLKANQPGLRQHIASAFLADLGVTSALFAEENCTEPQRECATMPPGRQPELQEHQLDALLFYIRALEAPARRDAGDARVQRGERLFAQLQCAVCHRPALVTGEFPPLPQLARQTIHPYTDLLLHDMGEGLSDGRPDFEAGPRDWRTTPLWGLGLSEQVNGNGFLLHDGRARNVVEAILWHGGDARPSRDAFARLPRAERDAVVAFLRSL
jgi:CxxC motif-containing protein (DUF1111 family)